MIARLADSTAIPARLCGELLPHAGSNAQPSAIHDAAVIGFLLWPHFFTRQRGKLSVTPSGVEEGRTSFIPASDGPHEILMDVARDDLFRHMLHRLRGED